MSFYWPQRAKDDSDNAVKFRTITIWLLLFVLFTRPLCALETVRFKTKDGPEKEIAGRILLMGPQGEFFLQGQDGQLFQIHPDSVLSHESDKAPFVPWTQRELEKQLGDEFGANFHVLATDHYLIVYNTSEKYAKWTGEYFDRFYKTYHSIWTKFKLDLEEPEFPLVAILFSDKKQFDRYAQKEIGEKFPLEMNAYYHKWTNRIVLCDLTGIEKQLDEASSSARNRVSGSSAITNRPGAGYNLSATIHEAAHQIGCNNGMFPRLAPIPLWLLEGIAMLHEVADVDNPKRAESGETKVNKKRLSQLRAFNPNALASATKIMLQRDDDLRSPQTAEGYYGLAWGFTYFLYKKKAKEFRTYLQEMAAKTAEDADSPTLRLDDFENHFGSDWDKLQKEFLRFEQRLK